MRTSTEARCELRVAQSRPPATNTLPHRAVTAPLLWPRELRRRPVDTAIFVGWSVFGIFRRSATTKPSWCCSTFRANAVAFDTTSRPARNRGRLSVVSKGRITDLLEASVSVKAKVEQNLPCCLPVPLAHKRKGLSTQGENLSDVFAPAAEVTGCFKRFSSSSQRGIQTVDDAFPFLVEAKSTVRSLSLYRPEFVRGMTCHARSHSQMSSKFKRVSGRSCGIQVRSGDVHVRNERMKFF